MPTVYELALMAEDVYDDDASGIYAASFPEATPPDLPDRGDLSRVMDVCDGGFAAALYQIGDTLTISYRGTDVSSDAVPSDDTSDDAPPHFARALDFVEDAIDRHRLTPAKTYLCGHSMGGTLAEYVARHLAQNDWLVAAAMSFNAPTLTASLWDRAVMSGMTRLTEGRPVGVGIAVVHEMLQQDDLPQDSQITARLIRVSLDGDLVTMIGDAPGPSFTLTAPDFICPSDFTLNVASGLPENDYARQIVLREVYLHSIHTLRRVLADDPLGRRQVDSLIGITLT